jgi:hypothetical protein
VQKLAFFMLHAVFDRLSIDFTHEIQGNYAPAIDQVPFF